MYEEVTPRGWSSPGWGQCAYKRALGSSLTPRPDPVRTARELESATWKGVLTSALICLPASRTVRRLSLPFNSHTAWGIVPWPPEQSRRQAYSPTPWNRLGRSSLSRPLGSRAEQPLPPVDPVNGDSREAGGLAAALPLRSLLLRLAPLPWERRPQRVRAQNHGARKPRFHCV